MLYERADWRVVNVVVVEIVVANWRVRRRGSVCYSGVATTGRRS